jgi:hypothetical protein
VACTPTSRPLALNTAEPFTVGPFTTSTCMPGHHSHRPPEVREHPASPTGIGIYFKQAGMHPKSMPKGEGCCTYIGLCGDDSLVHVLEAQLAV